MQEMIEQLVGLSPCDYADGLGKEQFVNFAIKPLWAPMPRVAGPAFTVKCDKGDHLSLHAAIYRANPGDILVVQADPDYAAAGGNVCAIAQQRGITAMIIDGTIRDLAEVREAKFPVFALGVMPKPAAKKHIFPFNQSIVCGGVTVNGGDFIVADEEGIAVIPNDKVAEVYAVAKARADKDKSLSLQQWQAQHFQKVESILQELGYSD